ncbi:hypothetical protein CON72_27385 [Bacillus wiedmannii]|nr:hypothetical protein CON72_27385 [Bacillus wiedmannii]
MYYDYDEFYSRPQISIGTGVSPLPVVPTTPSFISTGGYPTNPGIAMPFTYQQIASLTTKQKQVLGYWLTEQLFGGSDRPPFTYQQIESLTLPQKQVLINWLNQLMR